MVFPQTRIVSNRFWKWPVTLLLNRKSLPKVIKVNLWNKVLSEQATLSVGCHWSTWSTSQINFLLDFCFFLQKTLLFSHLKFSLNTKPLASYASGNIILMTALKHGHPKDLQKRKDKVKFTLNKFKWNYFIYEKWSFLGFWKDALVN